MKKLIFSFLLSIILFVAPATAWDGRVVAVSDGDTITVEPIQGGDRVKVRLYGIDCPESRQPYGQTARAFVADVALFQPVDVEEKAACDRYGRTIAVIRLPGGLVLQEELLKAGLAWIYPQYCTSCSPWEETQKEARADGRGLWQDDDPTPPWMWRKARWN